jgi:CheY-specific phosphatase CheX
MRGLVAGIFMVIAGVSGQVVFGTDSSTALVIAGVMLASFGLFQQLTSNQNHMILIRIEPDEPEA